MKMQDVHKSRFGLVPTIGSKPVRVDPSVIIERSGGPHTSLAQTGCMDKIMADGAQDLFEKLVMEAGLTKWAPWRFRVMNYFERPSRGIPLLSGVNQLTNGVQMRFKPPRSMNGYEIMILPPSRADVDLAELAGRIRDAAKVLSGDTPEEEAKPEPQAVVPDHIDGLVKDLLDLEARVSAPIRTHDEFLEYIRDEWFGESYSVDYVAQVFAEAENRGLVHRAGVGYKAIPQAPLPAPPAEPEPPPVIEALPKPPAEFDFVAVMRAMEATRAAADDVRKAEAGVAEAAAQRDRMIEAANRLVAEAEVGVAAAKQKYLTALAAVGPDVFMTLAAEAEKAKAGR